MPKSCWNNWWLTRFAYMGARFLDVSSPLTIGHRYIEIFAMSHSPSLACVRWYGLPIKCKAAIPINKIIAAGLSAYNYHITSQFLQHYLIS